VKQLDGKSRVVGSLVKFSIQFSSKEDHHRTHLFAFPPENVVDNGVKQWQIGSG
jgi:hypothetical protein